MAFGVTPAPSSIPGASTLKQHKTSPLRGTASRNASRKRPWRDAASAEPGAQAHPLGARTGRPGRCCARLSDLSWPRRRVRRRPRPARLVRLQGVAAPKAEVIAWNHSTDLIAGHEGRRRSPGLGPACRHATGEPRCAPLPVCLSLIAFMEVVGKVMVRVMGPTRASPIGPDTVDRWIEGEECRAVAGEFERRDWRPNATRAPSPCAPLTAQPRRARLRFV